MTNLIMPENYEEFISLTLRTRNSKRPSRMLARNRKHKWLPLCLAKFLRTIRIMGVVHPMISNQNMRVFCKPVNPQDYVWEIQYRITMKTILQERETIHYSTTIWYTNLFLCPKRHENSCSKGSSGQGMGKIGEIVGMEPDESQK